MKKLAVALVVVILIAAAVLHVYADNRGRLTTEPVRDGLLRTVSGHDLISPADPPLTLRIDAGFEYLGGQKFVLYGVADTEQHFFVEKHGDGSLKSIYWIQYEAYLPGRPGRYHYDDSPHRVDIDGYSFFTDAAAFENDPSAKGRPGSDGALVRQFLAGEGLSYPKESMYARLVYLPDEERRKELMIIFIDDLSTSGYTASEIGEDGARRAQYAAVEERHLDRIRSTIEVLNERE